MEKLYDAGYNEIRDPELFARVVAALDAVVIDARFSPSSRDPQWRQASLEKRLPDHYSHVKALGNENFKSGPIKIVDQDAGFKILEYVLEKKNVILLCACWNRSECHRLAVAKAFEQAYGIASIPLTLKLCKEIAGNTPAPEPAPDPQMKFL